MHGSELLHTALAVINAYNAWDVDAIMALRAPDCIHRVLPESLGQPAMNNTEYRAYFESIQPLFENWTITITNTIEDQGAHKVGFHANSTGTMCAGPYANEYALFFHMTDDDALVLEIDEFVDSDHTKDYFVRLGECGV
ncbi:uncharacterized protein BCR38DRAFT_453145 [Pseudomassariella vexata]|uniref:SnoaL-like domain-containing protein n=1 Tax=Pseudomassariella vexata TaxID=1141098 RepID=A0A1Y2D695_9PEZI|nr:uncharacterized protein BCR38DRAFT_453145 [Pseudomassariella vexata]ORY54811.1 hypothetical protein BCR38DRAFT_453145 [Pseudomassariella vexata]